MILLEHISDGDWHAVERMRQALQSLVIDTGGQNQGQGVGVRFGAVTSAGAVLFGSGFTPTRNGAGDYTVALTFPRTPMVVVGAGATAAVYWAKLHATTPPSTTGFRVACINGAGVAVDGEFHWIAVF